MILLEKRLVETKIIEYKGFKLKFNLNKQKLFMKSSFHVPNKNK